MIRTLLLLALLFSASYGIGLKQMQTEHRVALVVGNAFYDEHELPFATKNSRKIKKFLEENGFYVYYGENLDKKNFIRLLRKFNRNLKPKGIGLIYFCGHSVQTKDKNYLIPVEHGILDETMILQKSISLNAQYSRMDGSYDRLNIVILDSSFKKPFGDHFIPKKVGLATVYSPKAHVSIFSNHANTINTSETFTQDFLTVASQHDLELSALKEKVKALRLKHHKPKPCITIAKNQPFYFVLPKHLPDQDALAYSKIKSSKDKKVLKAFINRYPNSKYKSKVQHQLNSLNASNKKRQTINKNKKFKEEADAATKALKKKNAIMFRHVKPEDVEKNTQKKPKERNKKPILLE